MAKYVLSAFADEAGATLEEQIAALQRNNIKYMEIRSVNGMSIADTPLKTVKEYKKALDAAGIKVMTIGSPIGKIKLTEDLNGHLATLLHTLGVAKILGAERIRMFSLFTDTPEEDKGAVFEYLDQMVDFADVTGIRLFHENEKDIYGDTDDRVIELIHEYYGSMGFIFDPANFIQCGVNPAEAYEKLKRHIDYFHIKDAKAENGEVVPAGEGDGHIADILEDYAKTHEGTMLTVEPHLKSFAGLKDHTSMKEMPTHVYKDNNESFDAAVAALKNILEERGLSYE